MFRTKSVLVTIFLTVVSGLVSGCDKDSSTSNTTIDGTFYSEQKQFADGSYEPEMVFAFDKSGKVIIENIYPARGANGQDFKEIFQARYVISGNRLQFSDVTTIQNCTVDGLIPFAINVAFRKDGDNLILTGDDSESIILKVADQTRTKKYSATQGCKDANQNTISEEPAKQPEAQPQGTKPSEAQPQGAQPQGTAPKGQQPQGTNVLPAEIPPVTVGPIGPLGKNETLPYIEIPKPEMVNQVVDAAHVECLKSKECPAFVGLLIGKKSDQNKTYMYQCSTTYLGNGYFSTNSHCYFQNVPSGRLTYESSCANKIWVKLPKTGSYKEETLTCEKVIYLTVLVDRELEKNKGRESMDVMIFKVKEPVARPAAEVDFKANVAIGESLTAWTVNPVHTKPGINGQIEMKTCKTNDPRELLQWIDIEPSLKGETYNNLFLEKCSKEIRKGNSGSTFFNNKGKGVMIVSSIYAKEETDVSSFEGYGSKYACLEKVNDEQNHVFNDDTRSKCFSLSETDVETLIGNIKTKKHNQVISEIELISQKLNSIAREARATVSGGIDPRISGDQLHSESDAFRGWLWIRAMGDFKPSTTLSYIPSNEFDKTKVSQSKIGSDGELLFNKCFNLDTEACTEPKSMVTDSGFGENYINNFSALEISVPSCLSLSKLQRNATNPFWEFWAEKKYEYSNVTLPVHAIYKAPYKLSPVVISGPEEIDSIQLVRSPTQKYELPYKIILSITDGAVKVSFNSQVDLAKNPEAKAIAEYIESKLVTAESCN